MKYTAPKPVDPDAPRVVHIDLPNGEIMFVPTTHENFGELVSGPVAEYTDPPATWDSVRGERNQLLKDTDWQASSDRTMSDAETVYRQALRDLPAQDVDGPGDVVWPSAP